MKDGTESQFNDKSIEISAGIARRVIQIGVSLALVVAILFLAAGRIDWIWAWVFLGIYVLDILINGVFMFHTGRETIAERGQPKEMKDWDKVVGGLWGIAQFILLPLVAGLDMRFRWSGEPGLAVHLAGVVMFVAGLGLFGWAMITNAFFSTVVRIQDDRGQTVCRAGPYRFVRHPGYVGAILQSLGIPLLLGSWWALIPAVLAAALMILRTALEDRTLLAGLPGYQDFAQQVRWRLMPGVW